MSDCCTLQGIPTPAVAGPALPRDPASPCDMAMPVTICGPTDPITVTGVDCLGAPLPVTDANVILTVPAPGAVQNVKICPAVIDDRKVLVWHESVTGIRSIQDIVVATGTVHVQSVTAVNTGTQRAVITDDFGNQTRLYPEQSWSWSAVTGQDAWDTLGYSSLTIDATGTDVHVTSTVLP